ncbi:MAG: DUF502 domain-containing protein [Planctomycetota bacterium]|nr:DUF502 domain-containing protein [Planctomycetota bacterium]
MRITGHLKNYFLRGLAVLVPTILTIWIFIWGYGFIQNNISIHINRGIVGLIMFLENDNQDITRESLNKILVDGYGSIAGFVIALFLIFVVGVILASVVGRTLWQTVEKFIMNTPFLKQVYPYVKQITDFLLTQEKQEKLVSRVVALEYPRKGIWAIGMVTGQGLKKVARHAEKEFITVFVPTTPTPFTGFVTVVPKEEVIDLDMTIEDAVRFIISAGVVQPQGEKCAGFLPNAEHEKKQEENLLV